MSKLRLIPISGSPHEIAADEATVGRDPSCDVSIPDGSVSRRHARLLRRGNGWAVIDEGSANGTFLDSQRIADAQIQPGQELRFGAVSFRIDIEVPTEELHPTLGGPEPTVLGVPPIAAVRPPPPPQPVAPPPLPVTPPPLAAPPPPPPPARASAPPPRPARTAAPPLISPPPAPPARQGKGVLFWTMLGCGGCLTMIVLVVVLVAGGAFVFMKGPVDAVKAQLVEMRTGDLDKAYGRLSESYRARLSRDDFATLVAEHPGLKENADASFWPPGGSVHIVNAEAKVEGTLVSTGGAREEASYDLVKESGEWKISGLRVEAAASR